MRRALGAALALTVAVVLFALWLVMVDGDRIPDVDTSYPQSVEVIEGHWCQVIEHPQGRIVIPSKSCPEGTG